MTTLRLAERDRVAPSTLETIYSTNLDSVWNEQDRIGETTQDLGIFDTTIQDINDALARPQGALMSGGMATIHRRHTSPDLVDHLRGGGVGAATTMSANALFGAGTCEAPSGRRQRAAPTPFGKSLQLLCEAATDGREGLDVKRWNEAVDVLDTAGRSEMRQLGRRGLAQELRGHGAGQHARKWACLFLASLGDPKDALTYDAKWAQAYQRAFKPNSGYKLLNLGRPQQAREYFRQLERGQRNASTAASKAIYKEALFGLAIAELRLQDARAAAHHFEIACHVDDSDHASLFRAGLELQRARFYTDAGDFLTAALEHHPSNRRYAHALATLGGAAANFNAAAALNLAHAQELAYAGNVEEAVKCLRKILAYCGSNVGYRHSLVASLSREGDSCEALRFYDCLDGKGKAATHFVYADLAARCGLFNLARKHHERAVHSDDGQLLGAAHFLYAFFLSRRGEHRQALDHCLEAIQLGEDTDVCRHLLSTLKGRLANKSTASACLLSVACCCRGDATL